jgi:hypothetical protein
VACISEFRRQNRYDRRMDESDKTPNFERLLAESWPPPQWCDVSVVVAVSGGGDSVACGLRQRSNTSGGRGSQLLPFRILLV